MSARKGKASSGATTGGGRPPAVARRHRLAALAAGLILAGAFYLLLIDTIDLPELYAGAAVAALAALVFEAGREQGFAEASIAARWLARSGRVLARVPLDVGLLSLTALRALFTGPRPRGVLRAVPFEHGGPRRTRDAGRRALAQALGSLAPNTIVIGVDPERNLILAHQLRRSGGAEAIDVLELR